MRSLVRAFTERALFLELFYYSTSFLRRRAIGHCYRLREPRPPARGPAAASSPAAVKHPKQEDKAPAGGW